MREDDTTKANRRALRAGLATMLAGLSALACLGDPGAEHSGTPRGPVETVLDPGEPSYLDELARGPRGPSTAPPPCVELGYPCFADEVPADVLARQDELLARMQADRAAGRTAVEIADALGALPDVAFASAVDTTVSFRVVGGQPLVGLVELIEPDVDAELGGLDGSWARGHEGDHGPTRRAALVVDESLHARTVKVATLAEAERGLELPVSMGPRLDDRLGAFGAQVEAAPSFARERLISSRVGAVSASTPHERWLEAFSNWRDAEYLVVHAHGARGKFAEGLPTGHFFFLEFTGVPNDEAGLAACLEYIDRTKHPVLANVPGLACLPFEKMLAIVVTLDTLHALGSAPLEQTVMYTSSCFFSSVDRQASSADLGAWLLSGDSVAFGWAGLAKGKSADKALAEVTKLMLEDGLRARDAFERVETKKASNGTLLELRADENDDTRARHVVFFADEDGRAIEPEGVGLLVAEYEGDRGWVAPTPVLFSGVLPDEVGAFETTAAVLTEQGGARFEPDTFTPSSPGFKRGGGEFDYIVPVEVVFGEQAPKHGERVDLRVRTELPEGGVSGIGGLGAGIGAMLGAGESEGYASFVLARPGCALATLGFSGGGGVGWHNANNVRTVTIPGADVFTISMARAERLGAGTPDERVEESAPAFSITVQGALPARGDSRTYASELVTFTGTVVDGVGSSAYAASGRDGDGSVTLTLTHQDDGSLRGRLGGVALYPGGEEFLAARVDVEFVSAPADAPGDTYQCF